MSKVRVITRDNGAGLSRDLAIVADVLRAHHEVSAVGLGRSRLGARLRHWWTRARCRLHGRYDAQLSLERIYAPTLDCAGRNLLIPNPEWFKPEWVALLPRFDQVLCKTRHAEPLFAQLGCATRYTGFTCADRFDPAVLRQATFFHLAGRSTAKGTDVVIEAWRRHPEWPCLTVVQRKRHARTDWAAPNIVVMAGYLDDAGLQRLQNAHRFHICPSEIEGFGHSIAEAMSVGAVVLTTDAAPMNELVDAACGLLLDCTPGEQMGLGRRYRVSVDAIEAGVARALQLSPPACVALGQRARARFLQRDAAFRERLAAVLSGAPASVEGQEAGHRHG